MSLSDYCDIAWTEIWDDCPPMGDHGQYRGIIEKLFLLGLKAWEITYQTTDAKGKKVTKTLGNKPAPGIGRNPPKNQMAQAEEWMARAKQLYAEQQAAKRVLELESPPDG